MSKNVKPLIPVSSMPAPYTMQSTGTDSAEITLYGDIVSRHPTDWDGNPVEGQFIILNEFLQTLKQIEKVKTLTIRIHSAGGNAYDAMTIHNRLKGMGADIIVIVDGVAMSGGSLIMCAGDKVKVYPGSLIMIHKCWLYLWGSYNADEMRKMADGNDAVDRSQAAVYSTKTGISEDELMGMMAQEYYMTGQEAIDKGFADEMAEGASLDIAASADRKTLFVKNMPVWVSARKNGIPSTLDIKTLHSGNDIPVEINNTQPEMSGREEGGNTFMAKTYKELQAEDPGLAEALMAEARAAVSAQTEDNANAAVEAERQRIEEIDSISALYDAETVQAAKYGKAACTAQEMAFKAAQAASKQGKEFVDNLAEDFKASGAKAVNATHTDVEEDKPLTAQARMEQGRAAAKNAEGGNKHE